MKMENIPGHAVSLSKPEEKEENLSKSLRSINDKLTYAQTHIGAYPIQFPHLFSLASSHEGNVEIPS